MLPNTARSDENGLAVAIRTRQREGRLPCADAFALAREWRVPPLEVARQAEGLGMRIGWCQLGLFAGAHKKGPSVAPEVGGTVESDEVSAGLRAAIAAAEEGGLLPCARAWSIGKQLGVERRVVGQAANTVGVHISQCQLGCFK